MIVLPPQAPASSPLPAGQPWYHALQDLGWIDITALAVIGVFFVVGLFKGFVWQVSRVVILLAAYFVAGRFGKGLGERLATLMGASKPTPEQHETGIYLAYLLIFVGVLIVLSLLALLLQKLVKKADMSFFDRLGGGLVGVVTGGAVVLFLLAVVHMFFQGSKLEAAARDSQSVKLSHRAVDFFGKVVPNEVRRAFGMQPLPSAAPAPAENAEPAKGN